MALVSVAMAALWTAQAWAQGAGDPAADRATSFQAMEGPNTESVPGGPLLVGAYAVVLVLLVAYILRLGRMHGKVQRDLDRLEQAVRAADRAAPPE